MSISRKIVVTGSCLLLAACSSGMDELREKVADIKAKPGERIDLALLDFAMPEMNGAQVATEIRARGVTAPIVFATGFADSEAIQKALTEEPYLLRKPYDMTQLSGVLNEALQSTDRAG